MGKRSIWSRIPFFRYEHRCEHITYKDMTPEQKAGLDDAFKQMDKVMKEMDRLFGIH